MTGPVSLLGMFKEMVDTKCLKIVADLSNYGAMNNTSMIETTEFNLIPGSILTPVKY